MQLLTGLQFDICHVIKTRAGFEIAEITRFLIWKYQKILRSMSTVKLFVYKTVKCEVINVEFLSRDLPLNNSAIMVKWKCLKLLYSSKGLCRIDSQLKVDTFEIINSWNTLYLRLGINNKFSFCVFVLTTLKRKYLFWNIFSIDLILSQVKAL